MKTNEHLMVLVDLIFNCPDMNVNIVLPLVISRHNSEILLNCLHLTSKESKLRQVSL
jgi:hypothetical protein